MNEAADSGRRCKPEPGQQRPREIVHKRAGPQPAHARRFFPPLLHTLSMLLSAAGRTVAGGGEEVERGVNNIQLRYMTQIKDAVCDAAAH